MTAELDTESRDFLRAAVSSEPHIGAEQRERIRLAVLAKGLASASLPAAYAAVSTSAAASTSAALKAGSLQTIGLKALTVWLVSGAGLGVVTAGSAQIVERFWAPASRKSVAASDDTRQGSFERARARVARERDERQPASAAATPQAGASPPSQDASPRASRGDTSAHDGTPRERAAAPGGIETAVPAPPPRRALELSQELRLMNELQAALRDGATSRAEELIARHAREFPEAQFELERLAATVFAACQRGDRALAGRAAQAFLARDPSSALAARVRASCANLPASNR